MLKIQTKVWWCYELKKKKTKQFADANHLKALLRVVPEFGMLW
jgi:hypothetical protein